MRTKIFMALFLTFFAPAGAFCASQQPDSALKERVQSIVTEVVDISARCASLDELGKSTVEQGREMLAIGAPAVYVLSNNLSNPDWKVRFWITDMLGYLENPDAARPLSRVINNPAEENKVKQRAKRSLKRLKIPLERNIH